MFSINAVFSGLFAQQRTAAKNGNGAFLQETSLRFGHETRGIFGQRAEKKKMLENSYDMHYIQNSIYFNDTTTEWTKKKIFSDNLII